MFEIATQLFLQVNKSLTSKNIKTCINCSLYKLYQKIDSMTSAPSYFTMRTWNFQDQNIQGALNEMSAADKETFKFDLAALNWESCIRDNYMGVRQFILKDEICTVPAAVKRYSR